MQLAALSLCQSCCSVCHCGMLLRALARLSKKHCPLRQVQLQQQPQQGTFNITQQAVQEPQDIPSCMFSNPPISCAKQSP